MMNGTGKEESVAGRSRRMMPLISSSFAPGKSIETIEAIEDPDERAMAWADYYQYTGRAQEAIACAEPYRHHADPALWMSARIIYFISGLAIGDADGARHALMELEERLEKEKNAPVSGNYCANIIKVMLFLREGEFQVDGDIPEELPEGAKFFVCYFLTLREYLRDEYEKAVGMAQAALLLGASRYPIAAIYLHIVSAASLVRIRQHREAERHFHLGWELAAPDGLIAPFAQQYVMLAGLNKKYIKPLMAEKYQEISRYADNFIPAWIEAHKGVVEWYSSHGLTKMEHIVAMLFHRGISVKEISSLMSISVNTAKRHIAVAYQKTDAKKRDQLPGNIIR